MTITILTQASSGAPSLNGSAGSLLNVLNYCLVTNMSWTSPYSGTNRATYKAPSGNQFLLDVIDSAGQNATWSMFESCTAEGVGLNQTPPPAYPIYLYKSVTADSTSRNWMFVSNGTFFYIILYPDAVSPYMYCFGDYFSYRPSDVYNTIIAGDTIAGQYYTVNVMAVVSPTFYTNSSSWGMWTMRAYTQLGLGVEVWKFSDIAGGSASSVEGQGSCPYPDPISGGIIMSKQYIGDGHGRRGLFPGLWSHNHPVNSVTNGTVFSGATGSALAGKTFQAVYGNSIEYIFETSNTWSF